MSREQAFFGTLGNKRHFWKFLEFLENLGKFRIFLNFFFRDCKSNTLTMKFVDLWVEFFLVVSKCLWRFSFIYIKKLPQCSAVKKSFLPKIPQFLFFRFSILGL
jgi:hypothetical protein